MKTFDVREAKSGYDLAVFHGNDHVDHVQLPEPDNGWEKCSLGVKAKKPAYYLPYANSGLNKPLFNNSKRPWPASVMVQEVKEFGGYIAVVTDY
jgi:hypothetical protein